MKILNLKVSGFRSLKSIDWRPGDLNIVIGPNASGKSNLLDLIEMLSSLPRRGLADYVQSRGGIGSLLWDGKAESIGVGLDLSLAELATGGGPLRYSFDLRPLIPFGSYEVVGEKLIRLATGREFILLPASCPNSVGWALANIPSEQASKRDESFLPFAGTVFGLDEAPYVVWQMLGWAVHVTMDTSPQATVRGAPVTRYETRIANDGSNLLSVLHTLYNENRVFAERVDAAMGAAFHEYQGLVFPPAADQRIQMRVRWKSLGRTCSSADLSDGTLRFLYLISILANPNLPSLIAIDEPETGLHPKMMSIVAEYAMDAATRTQLILTTHSPEFLDAFRETQPMVTVADLVDGATQLRTLSGEDLAYWLKEYTLGDIYRSGQLESME
jgi:predicted ATPase